MSHNDNKNTESLKYKTGVFCYLIINCSASLLNSLSCLPPCATRQKSKCLQYIVYINQYDKVIRIINIQNNRKIKSTAVFLVCY